MSSPMTLREAVEIVALGRTAYGDKCWQDEFQRNPRAFDQTQKAKRAELDGFARYIRARAIVDAAVEFVEALDGPDVELASKKHMKLRALERGEGSEVQP